MLPPYPILEVSYGRRRARFSLGERRAVIGPLVHVDAPARWLGGEEEAFAPLGGEAARHLCLDAINVRLSKKLFMTEYAADLSPQPAF
jgi:hypothetical protein